MQTHADKNQENKSKAVANTVSQKKSNNKSTFQFIDNRPEAVAQRKLQEIANNSPGAMQLKAIQDMANKSPQAKQVAQLQAMADNHSAQHQQSIQKKGNKTGLPDNLKTVIENLSGYSMDDVRVHYNSDKPAQLQAHAYAQGTDIHLASGQEKHLPHEAWHVVQQKQGRVKPTVQMKGGLNVNDDSKLEKEAEVMGAKSLSTKGFNSYETNRSLQKKTSVINNTTAQLTVQEAIQLAKELFSGNSNEITSWKDINRLKYYFTPEERRKIRKAANNDNQGATVRPSWVEIDTPQSFLPNSEEEVQGLINRVINQIIDTARTQGPQQITEAALRHIPYVGTLLDIRDVGNDLDQLATAIQNSDGIGAATSVGALISTLFGRQYVGYAATGVNAVRETATNYIRTTGAYKSSIGLTTFHIRTRNKNL
ncbi:MAG: DUF4157 domain-containing protein [Bacteroidota bacterium]